MILPEVLLPCRTAVALMSSRDLTLEAPSRPNEAYICPEIVEAVGPDAEPSREGHSTEKIRHPGVVLGWEMLSCRITEC